MGENKFSKFDYAEMRQMASEGIPRADICRIKKISQAHLSNVLMFRVGQGSKKLPPGGIYPDMIAEIKRKLAAGCYVDVTVKDEDNFRAEKKRYCRVTGLYPYVFTVQFKKNTIAFPYSDLLVRGSGVRFDRRKKT